jgi:hypothetical protein
VHVKPLRPAVLGGIAVIVGVLCWAGARLWDSTGSLPGVPSAAPIVLAAIAVILTATAISFRARLRAQRDREPGARGVEPLVAARAVMFAQASVLVASVVAGIYGGLAVFLFTAADQSARRGQAVTALFAVLTAAAVIAAGIFLQRVCRLPEDEDGA